MRVRAVFQSTRNPTIPAPNTTVETTHAGISAPAPIMAMDTNADTTLTKISTPAPAQNHGACGCTISVTFPGASNRSTNPGRRSVGVSYESNFAIRVASSSCAANLTRPPRNLRETFRPAPELASTWRKVTSNADPAPQITDQDRSRLAELERELK